MTFGRFFKSGKFFGFVVCLAGIALLLCFFGRFLLARFTDTFLTKYREVDAQDIFVGSDDDVNGERTFASPLASDGMIVRHISPRTPGMIRLGFRKPIIFDSFSIYFYGNLHSFSSALARDFWVYYRDTIIGNWHLAGEVRNNTSSVYRFRSSKTISTDVVEIIISRAVLYDNVYYGDARFYIKEKVNLFEGIKFFVEEHQRGLAARLIYYFIFLTILFLPGYVLINLIIGEREFGFDPDFKLIFSPIFSIVFWSIGTSLYYFTGSKVILNFYWFIFFCCLIIFLKRRHYFSRELLKSKFLLLAMALALLIIFLVIAERDYLYNLPYIYHYLDGLKPIPMGRYYGYEADNLFQWGVARVFLHRLLPWNLGTKDFLLSSRAMAVFDRTPVFPMITTMVLNFFGESHFIYQRFLETLAALYYGGIYLAMKAIFSKNVSRVVLLLALLNVPLSFMAFNAELFYKYFALYPVLLALALFFKERKPNGVLIAGLLGLAFLIHPMTLIFSATIILLYLFRYRVSVELIKRAGLAAVTLAALAGGWFYVFRMARFFAGVESQNIYWSEIANLDGRLIINKLFNFLNFFVPNIFLKNMVGGITGFNFSKFSLSFLRFSLISNLTPAFFVLLLVYAIRNGKKDYQALILGLAPLLAFLIFYLHQHDFQNQHILIYPFTIPFLLGYIVNSLIRNTKRFKMIIFGSYLAFMFVNLYFISSVFIKINCISPVVWWLFKAVISIFIFLSVCFFKTCLTGFDETKISKSNG